MGKKLKGIQFWIEGLETNEPKQERKIKDEMRISLEDWDRLLKRNKKQRRIKSRYVSY